MLQYLTNIKKACNIVAVFQSQAKKIWCDGVDYFLTTVRSSKIFRHGSYFVITFISINICLGSSSSFSHTLLGHANKRCNILTIFSWWFLHLSADCNFKKKKFNIDSSPVWHEGFLFKLPHLLPMHPFSIPLKTLIFPGGGG